MAAIDCGFDTEHGWFRLRAAAIILEEGCVLLAQNVKDPYYYSIGGAVHLQESVEEAILRECREETGLDYEIDRLCFIHENFFQDASDRPFHEVAFYFLMKERGSLNLQSHDVSMYGDSEHAVWVPLTQLPHVYAFPVFFRNRLNNLPLTPEIITTRESKEEHLSMMALKRGTTAFLPTDELTDGVIRLRCRYRMERDLAKNHEPEYRFDMVLAESGQAAGTCALRLGNGEALKYAGNIGYQVFPEHRGSGLAVRACHLLFQLAKAHGMASATITPDPKNAASIRTAEKAGAEFERRVEIPEGHPMFSENTREVLIFRRLLG